VSVGWLNLHNLLRSRKEDYIDWKTYSKWASQCRIPSSQLELVTQFLAEMGSMIHFPDPFLRDLVVLNPQWLADLMSSLLTFRHQWAKNGILRRKDIPHVFEGYKSDICASLLALLERFSIIYPLRSELVDGELPDADDVVVTESPSRSSSSSSSSSLSTVSDDGPPAYLVPARLPVSRPSSVSKFWPELLPAGQLEQGRIYEFSFLPLGFFPRFMLYVLHIPDIVGRVFWADGLVISLGDQLAKVEYEHYESNDESDRVCVYQLNILVRFSKANKPSSLKVG